MIPYYLAKYRSWLAFVWIFKRREECKELSLPLCPTQQLFITAVPTLHPWGYTLPGQPDLSWRNRFNSPLVGLALPPDLAHQGIWRRTLSPKGATYSDAPPGLNYNRVPFSVNLSPDPAHTNHLKHVTRPIDFKVRHLIRACLHEHLNHGKLRCDSTLH